MLAVCILAGASPLLAVRAEALASDDYTQWKQGDPEWNESAPWSGIYTRFMANAGCWITALSMLLRHYGFVSESVDEFNPVICAQELRAAGALTGGGDMVLRMVDTAYPGFVYAGSYDYSEATLSELFAEGYACALLVRGGRHMVAVKDVLEDGTVEIMDPGWAYTTLSEWGGASEIIVFGPIESDEDEIVPDPETTVMPEIS